MSDFVGRLKTPRVAAAPATPTVGEVYFDTVQNELFCYNGTAWVPTNSRAYARSPQQFGLLAWSYPLSDNAGAATPIMVTLVPWLFKIWIPETITLANMYVNVVTAGGTLTAGSNLGAVYNSAGVRLGTTATQVTPWISTGWKAMALTVDGGQSLTVTGGPSVFIWACLLAAGTTVPCFSRWTQVGANYANGLLAAAQANVGRLAAVTAGTGPPTSFTPSSAITLADTPHWVGVA